MATKYDVEKIRKMMQDKKGSKFKDPNEFRPPTAKEGETLRYRFYILPPLAKGDKCADGVASRSMDLFYVQNGSHWINNRSHACPRVHDEAECPICKLGFGLMGETEDKKRRSEIAKQFLPRTQNAVNIYFPLDKANPEDLVGKVFWMNASKQVYDIWEQCIMNDNPGDPEDPQACGVFYDENSAYLFQLEIKLNNKYNEYKTSKFLAGIGKVPLSKKDGRIEAILAMRHDLYTKFQERDVAAMAALAQQLQSGEPADTGFDEDEESRPKAKHPATSTATVTAPKPKVDANLAELGEEVETPKATTESKIVAKDDVENDEIEALLKQIDDPDK